MAGKIRERKCQHCGEIVSYEFGETPQECPFCGSPHWNKPREEYKLFEIQDRYVESGFDKTVLAPMYEILVFYSENIIKRAIKGKVLFSPEVLNEKAQDVALSLYEMYFRKEGYLVHSSFGGILSRSAMGVLYNPKVQYNDSLLSLDFELDERRKLQDSVSRYTSDEDEEFNHLREDAYDVYEKNHPEDTVDLVLGVVKEEKEHVRDDFSMTDAFLFLVGFRLNLEKNPTLNEFYAYWGDNVKQDIDNSLSRIHSLLENSYERY